MNTKERWGLVALTAILPMALVGTALADPPFQAEELDTRLSYDYDPDNHVLFVALNPEELEEGAEPTSCSLEEAGALQISVDETTGAVTGGPTGCSGIFVEGPQGQVNHGTFVSNWVHWLKDNAFTTFQYEGPRGQLVRLIAQSDLGKGEDQVLTSDAQEEAEVQAEQPEEQDDHGPPAHAKNKKTKKAKGGRGRGR
ncbi:MAG: hypothetical protein ACRDWX_02535 [Acidimicrobiia bacterium]